MVDGEATSNYFGGSVSGAGDGDGYAVVDDCDDTDADVNPGAEDVLDDGVDQDCDGADASSPEETGGGGKDGDGCGCDATGGSGAALALLLALLGATARRRAD